MIGRTQEMAAAHAVLGGGRHLLLEGPVGSGKTTLALAVCHALGRQTVRVDGDDRFTEGRLAGWFDPPLVLVRGYCEEAFVPGPLVRAMREGRVLFLNELNRLPEAAQNLLLPALDEGLVQVPHLGQVRAAEGSRSWRRRTRPSTWPPVISPRPSATGSSTSRSAIRAPRRKRRSSRKPPGVATSGWCGRRSGSRGGRGCTRACAAGRRCAARSPSSS